MKGTQETRKNLEKGPGKCIKSAAKYSFQNELVSEF